MPVPTTIRRSRLGAGGVTRWSRHRSPQRVRPRCLDPERHRVFPVVRARTRAPGQGRNAEDGDVGGGPPDPEHGTRGSVARVHLSLCHAAVGLRRRGRAGRLVRRDRGGRGRAGTGPTARRCTARRRTPTCRGRPVDAGTLRGRRVVRQGRFGPAATRAGLGSCARGQAAVLVDDHDRVAPAHGSTLASPSGDPASSTAARQRSATSLAGTAARSAGRSPVARQTSSAIIPNAIGSPSTRPAAASGASSHSTRAARASERLARREEAVERRVGRGDAQPCRRRLQRRSRRRRARRSRPRRRRGGSCMPRYSIAWRPSIVSSLTLASDCRAV